MTERDYTVEINELAKQIYGLFADTASTDGKLLVNLSYLCGVAIGVMFSMEKEIIAHRMSQTEKEETNGQC
jgi:hypothetical protein